MIASFREKWLKDFFERNISGKEIPTTERDRIFRRLQMLDDATCDRDLRSPPSNHFEKLSPSLGGKCSIRVSKQWRLVFEFDGETGQATGVYLDPHTYRK